jgi:hypothetical protein
MANNAQAYQREHPGYEETAWDGLQQTIDVIAVKGIKVVLNGGALRLACGEMRGVSIFTN